MAHIALMLAGKLVSFRQRETNAEKIQQTGKAGRLRKSVSALREDSPPYRINDSGNGICLPPVGKCLSG